MKRIAAVITAFFVSSGLALAQPVEDSNDLPFATNPLPASGDVVADTWTTLTWQGGVSSAMHQLYISDDFNDVNEGTIEPLLTSDAFQVVGSLGTPIP
ncbi:MAG: hypothetical protein ACYTE3_24410, partial [Planctomycetota bacterium]